MKRKTTYQPTEAERLHTTVARLEELEAHRAKLAAMLDAVDRVIARVVTDALRPRQPGEM